MIKILLIEDERIIADDLRISLEKDGFARVESSASFEEARERFESFVPDLILSDVQLNQPIDGIDTVAELCRQRPVPVIYLTAYSDDDTIARIEQTFPFAYLLKPYNIGQLKASVNMALRNFSESQTLSSEQSQNAAKLELLTLREREILSNLAFGKMSKEIAASLHISVYTVEQHKKNIRKKLNLNTLGELVSFATQTGLTQTD